ncbi:MAG: hypothetical protein AB7E67_17510 [Xanthobacteraceae bacterium]
MTDSDHRKRADPARESCGYVPAARFAVNGYQLNKYQLYQLLIILVFYYLFLSYAGGME